MNTLERGVEAIRRAEDTLRDLLAEAAAAYQYEELLVLGGWARQLHEIACGAAMAGTKAGRDGSAQEGALPDGDAAASPDLAARSEPIDGTAAGNAAPEDVVPQERKAASGHQAKASGKPGGRTKDQSGYPRFRRDGKNLVKIGWSKKDRKQYEHKAPKPVLDRLIASLIAVGGDGHVFATDDVLPLRDPQDGAEIPSYQAYLSLAWLRSEKLIEQHGRQGYSLPDADSLASSVEESWDRLARR